MVDKILTSSGVPFRECKFTAKKPATYAIYFDDVTTDGPDGIPCIFRHDITVELYEDRPDPASEAALEAAITAAGLQWSKQPRYWLQTEQQYQVIYEFNYIEKGGVGNG